jgi:pyruvate/2-oxoglutarate dehydrogenase complex dihydrolipoamide dehydrogenase (E3) component
MSEAWHPGDFDVVVVGAGPAGETVAGRCADHGLSAAIVERELVGGECSYWGCIPSKTLIRPGDVLAAARRAPGAAEAVTGRLDVTAAFAVTFTDPQVCAVGLTEAQAREHGLAIRTVEYGTGDVAVAYTLGNGVKGTSKLVIDDRRNVIVGATFTGPGLQELLHSATIAIAGEVPLERLWHAVPSFPTVSEVWLRVLEADGL